MRVLFSSFAHKTHYYNLVPLAWAMQTAGHEVRVASQPSLVDAITGTGLTAVPVGNDDSIIELITRIGGDIGLYQKGLDFTEQRPERLSWEYLLGMQTMITAFCHEPLNGDATIDELTDYALSWQPDLVVWEPMTLAAPIAATVSGAAHARLLWGPDVVTRARQQFLRAMAEQPEEHREDPFAEWMTWTLARYGKEKAFSEDLLTGQWTIDPSAPSTRLDLGVPTVGTRYVPHNGPSVIPDWLAEPPAKPRICLTVGVSARETLGKDEVSLGDLLEALGDLDAEVVATLDATQQALLPRVPDNTRLVDFVPMNALLPTCSVIINHGGAGTHSTAMLHGVPQVMLTNLWDAPLKAQQQQDLGAGIAIHTDDVTARGVRDAVARVLTEPSFREGAQRLRAEMLAEPSPNAIVGRLEELTEAHRRH
ncbi:activator-dependent family glycosyltransferase [Allokutzneria sp. A3M-2-11 16]|uniref:activator-dependent family glycosyltransferase n=1 Tax=Allokutzneria sp. A3M-2-11 16 TaxID=2962043 RepID=UPI0020B80D42|nr:activator-dependent family glycosyltransferase [Allokutzneria sp. A3M-2-11 16]MCP3804654.1 activator-dependent family glycosyltransferase [Allokutzneria sp. A3M-2-11 16]